MSSPQHDFFWQRHTDGDGAWKGAARVDGAHLAALRRGLGHPAGAVPAMWPFYRCLDPDGRLTARLQAEHTALTLYALHQQSMTPPMHRDGIGLGEAVLAVRRSDLFSPEAVDRRFAAAATATSLTELAGHLRGLITQMRTVANGALRGQPLDYTQLMADLVSWQYPDGVARVRRHWGSQYFTRLKEDPTATTAPTTKGNS